MGKRNKLAKIGYNRLQKKALKKKETQNKEEAASVVSEEEIKEKVPEQPKSLRHRRVKNNKDVLSRGQKRRFDKKQKFARRKELEVKVNMKPVKPIVEKPKKTDKFNLGDIDNDILNLLENISKEKKTVPEIKARKKKGRQIMADEINKIKKIFNNKNFQNNPIESMKSHIRSTQLINERNKKIDENFSNNYNKLKK